MVNGGGIELSVQNIVIITIMYCLLMSIPRLYRQIMQLDEHAPANQQCYKHVVYPVKMYSR